MRRAVISDLSWEEILDVMERTARSRGAPVYSFAFKNPFEVLIAAVLSTRTRDEDTLKACRRLFRIVKGPEDVLKLSEDEIDKLIRNVGFHRVKARYVREISRMLVERFGSKVPEDPKSLLSLPGVGRKVANVVLANAFGKPAIAVDTHVHRIANRMGIVRTVTPEETEIELKKLVPVELWHRVNRPFVGFGQTVCRPRRPLCDQCPFSRLCPKISVSTPPPYP